MQLCSLIQQSDQHPDDLFDLWGAPMSAISMKNKTVHLLLIFYCLGSMHLIEEHVFCKLFMNCLVL